MALNSMTLTLENGKSVPVIHIPPGADLSGLPQALGISFPNGAVALVGGAATFDTPEYEVIRRKILDLLKELAALAVHYNLAVVDGGTPFGVMKLMGTACAEFKFGFPLIGVAPSGKVAWNSGQGLNWQQTWYTGINVKELMAQQERTPLDANHSAFVLVEANEWGEEVEMLARVAHQLAFPRPALEVLVNGGTIARRDVLAYLHKGGSVIVIEGSGRFADELALAVRQGYSPDPEIRLVINSQRVHVFSLDETPKLFGKMLLNLGRW